MSNLFENARELPLLGAHPSPPDSGNYLLYRLITDNREYIQYDDGLIRYFRPREFTVHFANTGIDNNDWLSINQNGNQSRRSSLVIPFERAIVREFVWSSRNNMTAGNLIVMDCRQGPIGDTGDLGNGSPLKFSISTNDTDVTSFQENKRWIANLLSRGIVLDQDNRYSFQYDKTGAGNDPRDVIGYMIIEEIPNIP